MLIIVGCAVYTHPFRLQGRIERGHKGYLQIVYMPAIGCKRARI